MNSISPLNFDDVDFERRFGGIARLYGARALERFRGAHVCVVGVGGVGSWIVEALARSAIGKLTLIDLDNVAESNINRQIQALSGTVGQAKISALADRIAQINPFCVVEQIEDFVLIQLGNAEEIPVGERPPVAGICRTAHAAPSLMRAGSSPARRVGQAASPIYP